MFNRQQKEAFVQSKHARLGAHSPASLLPNYLFKYILSKIAFSEFDTISFQLTQLEKELLDVAHQSHVPFRMEDCDNILKVYTKIQSLAIPCCPGSRFLFERKDKLLACALELSGILNS